MYIARYSISGGQISIRLTLNLLQEQHVLVAGNAAGQTDQPQQRIRGVYIFHFEFWWLGGKISIAPPQNKKEG